MVFLFVSIPYWVSHSRIFLIQIDLASARKIEKSDLDPKRE